MNLVSFFFRLFLRTDEGGASSPKGAVAVFSGGCFWCMQPVFDKVKGVLSTRVGYTGGDKKDPTYTQVSTGKTGHFEAIEVIYNPAKISYSELLNVFFHNIDPTDTEGQFCDRGSQYRSAIFYLDEEQKRLAEAKKEEILASGKISIIHTEILPAQHFFPAEEEHQKYSKKHPLRYKFYEADSGRAKRLKDIWGK